MDTKKLAVFIDLAETQNYSRSAERMFLSQSTISKYIMSLEKEWQTKLFIRAHRQVRLTDAGKLILPKAKEILQQENQLNQLITDQIRQKEHPLVIQGLPSLPQYQAFNIITAFSKQYPNIKIQFNEATVDKLETALEHKNIDIVFTRIFKTDVSSYNTLINEQDRFVVLVPKNNPLSKLNHININMLENESILLLRNSISRSNPLFQTIENMTTKPKITYNGQRIELILEMLNQGAGVSVVMDKSFDLTGFDNIKVVPLVPEVISHLAFMKRKDNPSSVVELFWNFAKNKIKHLTHS